MLSLKMIKILKLFSQIPLNLEKQQRSWSGFRMQFNYWFIVPDPQHWVGSSVEQNYIKIGKLAPSKNSNKTLIPIALWLLFDFLSLKNYENVP
jgi:hypothetical protein